MSIQAKVSEIMTQDLVVLHDEDNLTKIAEDMDRFGLRHLPVVDGDKLVGLVSHRDLMRWATSSLLGGTSQAAGLAAFEQTFVANLVNRDVRTVGPDATVADAAKELVQSRFGALPVVDDNGKLLGMVTEYDLLTVLAAKLA